MNYENLTIKYNFKRKTYFIVQDGEMLDFHRDLYLENIVKLILSFWDYITSPEKQSNSVLCRNAVNVDMYRELATDVSEAIEVCIVPDMKKLFIDFFSYGTSQKEIASTYGFQYQNTKQILEIQLLRVVDYLKVIKNWSKETLQTDFS